MGLAGPKRKQKLVGAATSRNTAWVEDASLPGQRLLAQMGWQQGQGLGAASEGRSEALKAMYKMDNKGIGTHRAEKEAREKGLPGPGMDRWIGGGGELGGLFERLNAGSGSSSPAVAISGPSSPALAPTAVSVDHDEAASPERSSKRKSHSKDKKRKRDDKQSEPAKGGEDAEGSSHKRSKSKSSEGSASSKEERRAAKLAKKLEKEEKKAKKSKERSGGVKASAESSDAIASSKSDPSIAAAPSVIRNASRARYVRAKRQLHGDTVSMNEILGISANSSGANSPAARESPSVATPPLPPPATQEEAPESATSSATEAQAKADRKAAKKAAKDEAKKADKAKKTKKRKEAAGEVSDPVTKAAPAGEAIPQAQEEPAMNTVSSLSVHEYLTRRLMMRKAQAAWAKRADQEAVWGRLNQKSSAPVAGGVGVVV